MREGTLNILLGGLILLTFAVHPASGQISMFLENENIGKKAPDFTLKTLNEDAVNFSTYRDGKKAIVFFWATWCPHCREAMKVLKGSKGDFHDTGVKLVLVDVGETRRAVGKYVEKNQIDFDIFLDEEETVSSEYNLIGVPTFLFVSADGVIRDVQHFLPENYMELFSETRDPGSEEI